jgi:hypothetical protein
MRAGSSAASDRRAIAQRAHVVDTVGMSTTDNDPLFREYREVTAREVDLTASGIDPATFDLPPIEPFFRRVIDTLASEGPQALASIWHVPERHTIATMTESIERSLDQALSARDLIRRAVLIPEPLRRAAEAAEAMETHAVRISRLVEATGDPRLASLWEQATVPIARGGVQALRTILDDGGTPAGSSLPLTGIEPANELADLLVSALEIAQRDGLLALDSEFEDRLSSTALGPLRLIADGVPPEALAASLDLEFGRRRRWADDVEQALDAQLRALAGGVAQWRLDDLFSIPGLSLTVGDDAAMFDDGEEIFGADDGEPARESLPLVGALRAVLTEGDLTRRGQSESIRRLFVDFRSELRRAHAILLTAAAAIQDDHPVSLLRATLARYHGGPAASGPDSLAAFVKAVANTFGEPAAIWSELEALLEHAEWVASYAVSPPSDQTRATERPGAQAVLLYQEQVRRVRSAREADVAQAERARDYIRSQRPEIERAWARTKPDPDTLHYLHDKQTLKSLAAAIMHASVDGERRRRAAERETYAQTAAALSQAVSDTLGATDLQCSPDEALDVARRVFPGGPSELATFMDEIARDDEERELLLACAFVFVFEDIVLLDDRAVQKVLREVDTSDLATALRDCDQEVMDKVTRNMSKRAATLLIEDMEYMGPIRRRDVEAARDMIAGVIMKLEEAGEIVIARSGEDEMIV